MYAIKAWFGCPDYNKNRIIKLQKKTIRIICDLSCRETTAGWFKELSILILWIGCNPGLHQDAILWVLPSGFVSVLHKLQIGCYLFRTGMYTNSSANHEYQTRTAAIFFCFVGYPRSFKLWRVQILYCILLVSVQFSRQILSVINYRFSIICYQYSALD